MSWIDELKPGDVLVGVDVLGDARKKVTVKKIAPSGIVRTDYGSWKASGGGCHLLAYGNYGHCFLSALVQPTESLLDDVRKSEEAVRKMQAEPEKIQKAKSICEKLAWGYAHMTPEIAEVIIKAVEGGK